jgi:hypothetical protein
MAAALRLRARVASLGLCACVGWYRLRVLPFTGAPDFGAFLGCSASGC